MIKSFTNYSEQKLFLDDLVEFSIHEPKYGVGQQVVVKTNKLDSISDYLGIKVDASTILTKAAPDPNAPEIWVGTGEGEEVYLETGGKTYHLLGAASSLKSYFNGYKDTPGISWKADSIETGQCLGLYIDAN